MNSKADQPQNTYERSNVVNADGKIDISDETIKRNALQATFDSVITIMKNGIEMYPDLKELLKTPIGSLPVTREHILFEMLIPKGPNAEDIMYQSVSIGQAIEAINLLTNMTDKEVIEKYPKEINDALGHLQD